MPAMSKPTRPRGLEKVDDVPLDPLATIVVIVFV